jgi:hypothetical protein
MRSKRPLDKSRSCNRKKMGCVSNPFFVIGIPLTGNRYQSLKRDTRNGFINVTPLFFSSGFVIFALRLSIIN